MRRKARKQSFEAELFAALSAVANCPSCRGRLITAARVASRQTLTHWEKYNASEKAEAQHVRIFMRGLLETDMTPREIAQWARRYLDILSPMLDRLAARRAFIARSRRRKMIEESEAAA